VFYDNAPITRVLPKDLIGYIPQETGKIKVIVISRGDPHRKPLSVLLKKTI
jgi:hypothetical protein